MVSTRPKHYDRLANAVYGVHNFCGTLEVRQIAPLAARIMAEQKIFT